MPKKNKIIFREGIRIRIRIGFGYISKSWWSDRIYRGEKKYGLEKKHKCAVDLFGLKKRNKQQMSWKDLDFDRKEKKIVVAHADFKSHDSDPSLANSMPPAKYKFGINNVSTLC